MLAQSSDGGGGDVTMSYNSVGGIGDVNVGRGMTNNNMDSDDMQLDGTSSILGNSIITFSPMKDSELRRRARNNTILAKIQELEANASVQAARSERLRMMREEYEMLVRKYASNRNLNRPSSSRPLNVNAYYQNSYQTQVSQQQPFMSDSSQKLTSDPDTGISSRTSATKPTKDISCNTNPTYSTTGVNTDITGPVRPIMMEISENDLHANKEPVKWEEKAVKTNAVDMNSQTQKPDLLVSQELLTTSALPQQPQATTSSLLSSLYDGRPHQKVIVVEDDEKDFLGQKKAMIQMGVEVNDDDDESLHQTRRTQQNQQPKQNELQLPHPKARHDDSISISSPTSSPGENPTITSDTTEDILRLRQGLPTKERTWESKLYSKRKNNKDENEDISSVSLSLAYGPGNDDDGFSKTIGLNRLNNNMESDLMDVSLSDSTSVVHKRQHQRKLLLEQLSASKSSHLKKRPDEDDVTQGCLNDSSENDDEDDRSVINTGNKKQDEDDLLLCSSPTTAGATSESIGDSMMDSIQKTPDTLPRDDSELQGIAEVNEEEDEEQEEIELDDNNEVVASMYSDEDGDHNDDFVVTATAAPSALRDDKGNLAHSGINDKHLEETGMSLKDTKNGIKELELREQINDAREIRPNNLSSSKLGVPAEEQEEDFSHANNPAATSPHTVSAQQDEYIEKREKISQEFHEQVGQPFFEEESTFHGIPFQRNVEVRESNEKNMISHAHAPSAKMSAHSSSNSSFSTEPNARAGKPNADESVHQSNLSQKQSGSTGSSSTSSSRQESLEEQIEGGSVKTMGESGSKQDSSSQQSSAKVGKTQQSPNIAQSMHKRHQQLQQQVKKEREGKDVAADNNNVLDRIPSSAASSPKSVATVQPTTNTLSNAKGTAEKVGALPKTTVKSPVLPQISSSSSSTASPSSKRVADKVGHPAEGNSSHSASGNGVTVSNIRPMKAGKAPNVVKQGQSNNSNVTTVSSGPTGALNTGRRVRLKLNYDESESDSSEIAPVKGNLSASNKLTGNQSSASGQQQNSNVGLNESGNVKKQTVDDDFDDFFDM